MKKNDPLQYIRDTYKVPAFVGARVKYRGQTGIILRGKNQYIVVQLDGELPSKAGVYHPTWEMEYLTKQGETK